MVTRASRGLCVALGGFTWCISCNVVDHSVKSVLLIPISQVRNSRHGERLCNLPEATQLVHVTETRFGFRKLTPEPLSLTTDRLRSLVVVETLRPRERQWPGQGHTASWQSWNRVSQALFCGLPLVPVPGVGLEVPPVTAAQFAHVITEGCPYRMGLLRDTDTLCTHDHGCSSLAPLGQWGWLWASRPRRRSPGRQWVGGLPSVQVCWCVMRSRSLLERRRG